MRDSGTMILSMEKLSKYSKMDACFRDSMSMENLKESEDTSGPITSSIKDSGFWEWDTAQECGKAPRETAILDNGDVAKLMDMAFISGLTEIDTKDHSGRT